VRIVVIGATGHVGGYLVPRLVRLGHEIVAISRGHRAPYHPDEAWDQVQRVVADREAQDAAGTFGAKVAAFRPDVVIDMVCFTPESARQLVDALRGRVARLISCGSIWSRGTLIETPATEDSPRNAWGDYGLGKARIADYLLAESARAGAMPSIILHPGHISGPGWPVINPAANLDPRVWEALAYGEPVVLPNFGLETLHHVHADDVAQAFERAVTAGPEALGQEFFIVSPQALTLRGFAEAVAAWFGRDAELAFQPFDDFARTTSPENAETTFEHIARSHSMSIAKARDLLGYSPAHTSLEALREAIGWLDSNDGFRRQLAFV
jgi:nucleoside-diphosphate-sugar epimerase